MNRDTGVTRDLRDTFEPVQRLVDRAVDVLLVVTFDADIKTIISSTFASTARIAPCAFGTNAANVQGFVRSMPLKTSTTSDNCGIAFGDTKTKFNPRHTSSDQAVHKTDLRVRRYKIELGLQTVPWADFGNFHFRWSRHFHLRLTTLPSMSLLAMR